MKRAMIAAVMLLASGLQAQVLTDNFNNGISASNWQVFKNDAAGAPWSISASTGALGISKAADSDSSTMYDHLLAGVQSNFALVGDFSVSVNFNLLTLPLVPASGWNEAIVKVKFAQGSEFDAVRFTNSVEQRVEAFCNIYPYVLGWMPDSTLQGTFTVSRQGTTLSAYMFNGTTNMLLGQMSSEQFAGNAIVQLAAAQACEGPRPNTAIDIQFDNFTATADSIAVPEPATLSLLAVGGMALRMSRKRSRSI